MNLADYHPLAPISYSLGEPSKHTIIHQKDDLFVAHEHLFQNATPTRFYYHQADTFLFLIKGELYLQQSAQQNTPNKEQETALKKHQGIWLKAHTVNSITLLSPTVELCLIRLQSTTKTTEKHPFKKVSSGTVESTLERNKIKTWPLWQGPSERIALELYPPHYTETLYYQKMATQYFLPLNGTIYISNEQKHPEICPSLGRVIPKKIPRAILNPSTESTTVLSITTQQHSKGRILLLKKNKLKTTNTSW